MSTLSLADAIGSYRLHCRVLGLAPRTTETYFYALESLRSFLVAYEGADPSIPSSAQLRAFVASMLDRSLSRATIRIRMRAIKTFCAFVVREFSVDPNPFAGVVIPRVPFEMPQVLSNEEIHQLLRAAKTDSWYGTRNHALIAVFLDTGLRLSELISLDVDDVDIARMVIRVRNGKGSKERYVYAGRSLARALREWSDIRPFAQADLALFTTHDGRRLDKRNVARIVERAAARADLRGRRVHPHLLRHSFATSFIRNGGDPFSLQRILGHSDIKTTMIYVNLAGADLAMAHAKASPLDHLVTH
ncbi:MAG: tyrosine-type recombinase/integrase [Candidatus Bipolaricaulis sp.]|nr:tyrosine-type recombinase/integrase [Candidatus Bipolaricaulis sp.]